MRELGGWSHSMYRCLNGCELITPKDQFTIESTIESSSHAARRTEDPASSVLRIEIEIICGIAARRHMPRIVS